MYHDLQEGRIPVIGVNSMSVQIIAIYTDYDSCVGYIPSKYSTMHQHIYHILWLVVYEVYSPQAIPTQSCASCQPRVQRTVPAVSHVYDVLHHLSAACMVYCTSC